MEEDQEHTYRVVRFEVIPQSIRLEGEWGGVTRGAGLVDGPRLLLLVFSHLIPEIAKRPQCSIWAQPWQGHCIPIREGRGQGESGHLLCPGLAPYTFTTSGNPQVYLIIYEEAEAPRGWWLRQDQTATWGLPGPLIRTSQLPLG